MHSQRLNLVVILAIALGPSLGRAQPVGSQGDLQGRYDSLPTAVGPERQLPSATQEDAVRRARVVARVGEIVVRVGEVEDYLATANPLEREDFSTPAGRRGVVDRLMRFHLLAAEAESRGAVTAAVAWSSHRGELRALRQRLEREVRRDPGPVPPPAPPVTVPEQRFGIVAQADSRSAIEAWSAANEAGAHDDALRRGSEIGTAVQTPYGGRERQGEGEQVSPAIWAALFRTPLGQTSAPVRSEGRWAAVMCGGLVAGYVDEGPDESARRMLLAERVWEELRAQVRQDRVTGLDPSALDGVAFRLPNQAIDGQREVGRQAGALPPPPTEPSEAP